jgi:hypothetical protein
MYANKWTSKRGCSVFDEEGKLTDVAQTWAFGLAGLSGEAILNGLRACIESGNDWPPELPLFRKMCVMPRMIDGVPTAEQALHIAFRGKAYEKSLNEKPSIKEQWLHPIVYWAVRESLESGLIIWTDLQQAPKKRAVAIWEPIYQSFLVRMAQGEVFEFPETSLVEDQSTKALTPEEKLEAEGKRQANLSEIRKLLK